MFSPLGGPLTLCWRPAQRGKRKIKSEADAAEWSSARPCQVREAVLARSCLAERQSGGLAFVHTLERANEESRAWGEEEEVWSLIRQRRVPQRLVLHLAEWFASATIAHVHR